MRFLIACVLTLLLVSPAHPQANEKIIAIRGGTILTVTKGIIENGTILIKDGKIIAVGKDVVIPSGAEVIDATGKYVMPGIVDTHSHMGVYSWPDVPANADGNEATSPIMPHVRAEDSVNLDDPAFKRALAGGVTTVQLLPGSANMIGGETAIVKLRLGNSIDRMKFAGAPRGLKMASGENPKRVYGQRNQLPSTRMGNFAVLREAFTKTQEYMSKWDEYEKKKAVGDKEASPPDKDLRWETLADVLRGKIRVHIHCYRQDELITLMKIADEFGYKIASLQHCLEGYKVADEIAKRNIGVATFSDWWGYKMEALDAIPQSPALLTKKGVRVAIHSDSSDLIQRLYHEAAKTIRYGLSEEDALKSITLNPAWMLGLDDRIGSIEVGKDADIAIFTKHPFDVYTLVEKTLIDGAVVFDRAKNKDYFGGVR